MMSQEDLNKDNLIREIEELAELAKHFPTIARQIRAEVTELQRQLEVIRQHQVLT
jgi:hypothetical protein